MTLASPKLVVLGFGLSGHAAAELAAQQGYAVTVLDTAGTPELRERAASLERRGHSVKLEWNQAVWSQPTDLAVISPGIAPDSLLGRVAASLTCPVISELEFGYRHCSCPILAVTGTNGKTTTVEMLTHCLRHAGKRVMAAGNIGLPLCEAARKSAALDWLVVEVSSFQLERCERFAPYAAAILNVTPDHLDRYSDMAAYRQAKTAIFKGMASAQNTVLHQDLLAFADVRAALPPAGGAPLTFTTATGGTADLFLRADGQICRATAGGEVVPLMSRTQLRLRGRHNVENAMAVIALCERAGVPFAEIVGGLESFAPSPHRLELVAVHGNIRYINDSKATNPDAVCQALRCMADETPGKRVLLLAGGLDKGLEFSLVLPWLRECVKEVFLIGKCKEQLAEQWGGAVYCSQYTSFAAAVDAAVARAVPGDTVLLSPGCASQDMFANYAERGKIFGELVKKRIGE